MDLYFSNHFSNPPILLKLQRLGVQNWLRLPSRLQAECQPTPWVKPHRKRLLVLVVSCAGACVGDAGGACAAHGGADAGVVVGGADTGAAACGAAAAASAFGAASAGAAALVLLVWCWLGAWCCSGAWCCCCVVVQVWCWSGAWCCWSGAWGCCWW